jgi:site-specific recombinase XerD
MCVADVSDCWLASPKAHSQADHFDFRRHSKSTALIWRSCAQLCHQAGGELEQIQFLLGHVSVQTTEEYLGCKQRLRGAVNDRIGIEP